MATTPDLARLGLPPADALATKRYPAPTAFRRDGTTDVVGLDALRPRDTGLPASAPAGAPPGAAVAGTGCLGIRPGALVLFIEGSLPAAHVAICTLAHVYANGTRIATAGHCAKTGAVATVVGFLDQNITVLLDFGTVALRDARGLGNDWALIDVWPAARSLVTANMCAWGGPWLEAYKGEGSLVAATFPRSGAMPSVAVDPDPSLVQQVVHYGHGAAVGPGGTARTGAAVHWGARHFMFVGAIYEGDSGSGVDTGFGHAAGIATHVWVDPAMQSGLGIVGGTRATVLGEPVRSLPVFIPAPT